MPWMHVSAFCYCYAAMSTAAVSPVRQAPVTRTEIAGWCMYDAADSAFTTVIITALYAPFCTKVIVGDSMRGTHIWGYAFGISEVDVGILAPILGAIADFSGSRKKLLAACALAGVMTAPSELVSPFLEPLGERPSFTACKRNIRSISDTANSFTGS